MNPPLINGKLYWIRIRNRRYLDGKVQDVEEWEPAKYEGSESYSNPYPWVVLGSECSQNGIIKWRDMSQSPEDK